MDSNITNTNTQRLEEKIDQLSDENQFNFLCVLEALNFVQNERETHEEETNQIKSNR